MSFFINILLFAANLALAFATTEKWQVMLHAFAAGATFVCAIWAIRDESY